MAGTPPALAEYVDSLTSKIRLADANAQIRQQLLWREIMQGTPAMAGFDQVASLGLAEVQLEFVLVRLPPSFWWRSWNRLRTVIGLGPAPPRRPRYDLTATGGPAPPGVRVRLLLRRDPRGVWQRSVDPTELEQDAQVPELPS